AVAAGEGDREAVVLARCSGVAGGVGEGDAGAGAIAVRGRRSRRSRRCCERHRHGDGDHAEAFDGALCDAWTFPSHFPVLPPANGLTGPGTLWATRPIFYDPK